MVPAIILSISVWSDIHKLHQIAAFAVAHNSTMYVEQHVMSILLELHTNNASVRVPVTLFI